MSISHKKIIQALSALRPGCVWTLTGEDLSALDWDKNNSAAPPTMEEIEKYTADVAYVELRQREYPMIGDQLDAIWKILNGCEDAQSNAVKQSIIDVKEKYPAA